MTAGPLTLPQLVPNRIESMLRRIHDRVWSNPRPVPVTGTVAAARHRSFAEAATLPRRTLRAGESWGRLFDQRWFHLLLPPESPKGTPRYLEWRDQGEATLWIEGTPYFGFDVAHRRVILPANARAAWIEGYCCQSAIWHPDAAGLSPKGSLFTGAFTWTRDDAMWDAVQDLQALFDLLMHLRAQQTPLPPPDLARTGQQPSVENATPVYRQLLHRLNAAANAFDSGDLSALRKQLTATRRELRDSRAHVQATLTGHAHIDLVWLWPERMGEAKAVHTFATVNRLMDRYPEFRFAYSQPASYRAVERRAPKLAQAVTERMRSGQWQATGAMDVESDTLLPCGEALARSFLLGQEEFTRLSGAPAKLLWLPDVFGYSGCLPQLMRLAGIEWFFTTKLTWSAVTRFPYSSFVWRGSDGSEVVAHVTQNAGYNNRLDLGELDANARGHVQADIHGEFLHPTGYGDGGGGPTEEMCERARRLNALAGTPALSWDQPENFFARLARRRRQLPVYQGECYLEYHRGTYTTHSELKSAFRGLERALQTREAVAAATGEAPDLTAPWRRLVFAQFHDYIPGSSFDEVYAAGVPEMLRLATEQLREASRRLKADDGAWHSFNVLPQRWRGWVQRSPRHAPVWADLPPLGSQRLDTAAGATPEPATLEGRRLASDRVRAEIGADGWLKSLAIDGREIAFTAPAARAVLYADHPSNYDAWDIDRHTLDLASEVKSRPHFKIEKTRGHRVMLSVTRALGRASRLTVRYRLDAGEAVLRIEAEIDWHEENTLLKLHFPTAYRGASARFGAPFGSVLRSQQPGSPAAEAQWEVPGSRWAAVAHDGERAGLALVTEAKYGFSARDGDLTVSLLRGARITGCDDRYAAPAGLSRHRPASPFSDQGRHVLRLALGAYDACGPAELHPAALADTLFTAPLVYSGAPRSAGLIGIDGSPTLLAAWARPRDARSWVLRLHEVSGQSGRATLRLAHGWTARRCGLDGTPAPATRPIHSIDHRPYEIVSVLITASE